MKRLLVALAVLGILFACHQTQPEPEEVFTFPGLADSLARYDSAYILLKTPEGQVIDTLFHGKVTPQTNLRGLRAEDYKGGKVVISIEGYRDGEIVSVVEKVFDGARDSVETTMPVKSVLTLVDIGPASASLFVGDSIALPTVTVLPVDLKDRSLKWTSSGPGVLLITATHLKGSVAGKTWVRAILNSDTTKRDSLEVEVFARPVKKPLDSLRLRPESLTVAVRGPLGRFLVDIYPDTAAEAIAFGSLDSTAARVDAGGWVTGLRAAITKVIVFLKSDPSIADTARVEVLAPLAVDSVRFNLDSIEVVAGGAAAPFRVSLLPALANPAIRLAIQDSQVAAVDTGHVRGLKIGKTLLVATSIEDTTRADTLRISVLSGVPERPLVRGPSLPVNTLTPTWTWKSAGGGNGTFRYRLDSEDMTGAVETTDTSFTPLTALTEASHTLVVQERNDAGRWSPSGRFALRIDTTRPAAPKVNVTPASPTNETRPTWTWNGGPGDAHRYYRFKLDDDGFRTGARDTTGTSYRPPAALSDTVHTLYVQERDSAGNWSNAGSAPITIDTQRPAAPTVSVSPASPTNDATPTWTWTGAGPFRYRLDNPSLDTGATETSTASFTSSTNLSEGAHILYVQQRDAAGNWSLNGSKDVRVDVTPPAPPRIDSTPLSPLNTLRPKWTWRSGGGIRLYRFRIDTSDLVAAQEKADTTVTPSFNLSQGAHTFYVQERDSAGNWSSSASREIVLSLQEPVGSVGFTEGQDIQVAVSPEGTPYIAYLRGANIAVKMFNGVNWEDVGSTAQYGVISKVKMKVDSKGVPYIAYTQPFDSGFSLRVMKYQEFGWQDVGVSSYSRSYDEFHLGFDSVGTPYLGYFDRGLPQEYGFTVKKYGSAWERVGDSNSISGPVGFGVAGSGEPYAAYSDYSDGQTKVARLVGGKWSHLPNIGAFVSPYFPCIAVTKRGRVFVSYYADEPSGYISRVVAMNGVSWEVISNHAMFNSAVDNLHINVNGLGELFAGGGSVLKYDGVKWMPVGKALGIWNRFQWGFSVSNTGIPYYSNADSIGDGPITVRKTSFDP